MRPPIEVRVLQQLRLVRSFEAQAVRILDPLEREERIVSHPFTWRIGEKIILPPEQSVVEHLRQVSGGQ